jgi:hypothetical protein
MMKALIAGLLTAAILAAMIVLGSRPVAPTAPAVNEAAVEAVPTPAEDAVRALIQAGDTGDVAGYLEAFADPIRARLAREVEARGRQAFVDDLRRAAGARKGHAVFAAEPDGDNAARVVVETIYPDRNERQTYRVVRESDDWRVAEVATVRTLLPSAPFGAPANPSSPADATLPKVGLTVETGVDPESP